MSVTEEKTVGEWIESRGGYEDDVWVVELTDREQVGYGLFPIAITREQVEELLAGKVLRGSVNGEYGILLHLKTKKAGSP
jgi:hypothetical protein